MLAATTMAEPAIATLRVPNVPTPGGTVALSPKWIEIASSSTCRRSAAIWAKVVSWPWPWALALVATTKLPSASRLIAALSQPPPARST